MLVINKAVWDGLSADQQDALTTAAANIAATSLKIFTTPGSTVAQDLAELRRQVPDRDRRRQDRAREGGQTAIASLAPESQDYVTQIQDLAKTLPAPAASAALPTTKTGDCVPPAG